MILSNRRSIFQSGRDDALIWQLVADVTFLRPDGNRILNDLRRRFPNPSKGRVLLSSEELMQIRRNAKEDVNLKEYLTALKMQYGTASKAFSREPIPALLPRSTAEFAANLAESADSILAFATLYRVTGDKKYAERIAQECEALAAFSDWNSTSMSSVGIVALAVAIGYDWCRAVWSEARKAIIERAMLRNGMRIGLDCYDGNRKMWILGGTASALINAGMLAMALALSDVYPETSLKLLNRIFRNVEPCFASYAPDGGYSEGVSAWEKSFRSLSLIIAMLQNACGTDYGFLSAPGFAATANFPVCVETANGVWNYHNSAAVPADTSMMFWLSRQINHPFSAWMRRQQLLSGQKAVHPFDILLYAPVADTMTPHMPMDAVYRKAGLAVMRSGFGKEDWFVGLHGGSNSVANGDLDAGSFILEAGGVRFFCETGGREELPLMFRRRGAGQNTLLVNPAEQPLPDQNPAAVAPIVEMKGNLSRVYAVVDMSDTNSAFIRARRGVMLTENRSVAVIQDEATFSAPGQVLWNSYTDAQVKINGVGKSVALTKDGKTLLCKIGGFGTARFAVESVANSNLTRLYILAQVKEKLRLSVTCSLMNEDADVNQKRYETVPMSKWGE